MNKKQLSIIIGIFAALMSIPVIIWLIISYSQQGTEEVSLYVLPADATVRIDDKEYTGNASIRLEPGTYSAIITKEGFATDTQVVEVSEGGTNSLISTPMPTTEEAYAWVEQNQEAYQQLEATAGEIALTKGKKVIEKYPIVAELPIQKAIFSIGYRSSESGGVIITITATEGYREAALQEIRDRKYSPGDYIIEFNNYENPFNE